MRAQRFLLIAVTLLWSITAVPAAMAAEADDLFTKIEQMASLGDKAERSLGKAITEGIEANPAEVTKRLVPKLKDKGLKENQLAVYVWALGLAKDKAAVDGITALYRQSSSEMVRGNCLGALAEIGGKDAEDFLLSVLKTTTDKKMRFTLLNLLAQLQSEAVLPAAEELLRQDPNEYYWQSIFVFGKIGDKAVPYLLQRISHKDKNVRANSINVLGQWLIAPEAAKPFQEQFWLEKNEELRGMLLSSLERIISDLDQLQAVFEQIVATEKNPKLAAFAQETLGSMPALKKERDSFRKNKKVSSASFQQAYGLLFKSAGKEGSYDTLAEASTEKDEPRLKALRERILQRASDEAFYDYQKVNDIIMRNRMAQP